MPAGVRLEMGRDGKGPSWLVFFLVAWGREEGRVEPLLLPRPWLEGGSGVAEGDLAAQQAEAPPTTPSTLYVSPSPWVRLWGGLGGPAKHPHLLGSGYLGIRRVTFVVRC